MNERRIRGEERLCLSISVRQQHSSSNAALIEPHRAALCLLRLPQQSILRHATTDLFIIKKKIFESDKRAESSLTGTLQWFYDILCEVRTIVIISHDEHCCLTRTSVLWRPLLCGDGIIQKSLYACNRTLWNVYKCRIWFHIELSQNALLVDLNWQRSVKRSVFGRFNKKNLLATRGVIQHD